MRFLENNTWSNLRLKERVSRLYDPLHLFAHVQRYKFDQCLRQYPSSLHSARLTI